MLILERNADRCGRYRWRSSDPADDALYQLFPRRFRLCHSFRRQDAGGESRVDNDCDVVSCLPSHQALLFYWTFSNFITLIQAFVLKQAPVRRLLRIPSPPPAPPPPKGTVIEKPPTLMDTFDAVRDYFGKTHQQALARAKMPKSEQTIGHVYRDVIRETGVSQAPRVAATSTTSQTSKPLSQAGSPVLDAVAEAKAQRVAAARERRNRNK